MQDEWSTPDTQLIHILASNIVIWFLFKAELESLNDMFICLFLVLKKLNIFFLIL